MATNKAIATDYKLIIGGRYIRIATMVTYPDGRAVKFMDRIGKREAIRQAEVVGVVMEASILDAIGGK